MTKSTSADQTEAPINLDDLPDSVKAFVEKFTTRAMTTARNYGANEVRAVRAAFAEVGVQIPLVATITVKHKVVVPEGTKDLDKFVRDYATETGGEYYTHDAI